MTGPRCSIVIPGRRAAVDAGLGRELIVMDNFSSPESREVDRRASKMRRVAEGLTCGPGPDLIASVLPGLPIQ